MSERPSDITPGDPLQPGDPLRPAAPSWTDHASRPERPNAIGIPSGWDGSPAPLGGPDYVLAGWWPRVGAALIDLVVIAVLAVVCLVPVAAIFPSLLTSRADGWDVGALVAVGSVGVLLLLLVVSLYAPLMLWKTNGRTLGRMATGIRVVRANGEPMTLGVALLREFVVKGLLVGLASQFTIGLAAVVDVLWPLWDRENRALHDFPVDTRTVVTRPT